jgi:hypothetical protein
MIPMAMIDITWLQGASGEIETLRARCITFVTRGHEREWEQRAARHRLKPADIRSVTTPGAVIISNEYPPDVDAHNAGKGIPK